MASPEHAQTTADLMGQYGPFAQRKGGLYRNQRAPQRLDDMINWQRDNLNFIFDQTPKEVRDQTKEWYVGGRVLVDEAAKRYGITPEQAAAVYAALSPKKDWYQNVYIGDQLMDTLKGAGPRDWTPEMSQTLDTDILPGLSQLYKQKAEAIRGRGLADINDDVEKALWVRTFEQSKPDRTYPFILPSGAREGIVTTATGDPRVPTWANTLAMVNAVRAIEDGSLANLSRTIGGQHKVRSFYNNLFAPQSLRGDTTVDTHAVAAGFLSPFGLSDTPVLDNLGARPTSSITGVKGTYPVQREALVRAAADQGVLPREMQSITWESVRGLFNNKSDAAKNYAKRVWEDYSRGLIGQGQAQRMILEGLGGINPPTWLNR